MTSAAAAAAAGGGGGGRPRGRSDARRRAPGWTAARRASAATRSVSVRARRLSAPTVRRCRLIAVRCASETHPSADTHTHTHTHTHTVVVCLDRRRSHQPVQQSKYSAISNNKRPQ